MKHMKMCFVELNVRKIYCTVVFTVILLISVLVSVMFTFKISFKISIRCKESTTLDASVEDFRPSSDSLLHLINHNTIQWYSRWNTSNLVLSEEKRTKIWSILMSSQDAMILLYPAMSSCGDPASAHSNTFTIFSNKS